MSYKINTKHNYLVVCNCLNEIEINAFKLCRASCLTVCLYYLLNDSKILVFGLKVTEKLWVTISNRANGRSIQDGHRGERGLNPTMYTSINSVLDRYCHDVTIVSEYFSSGMFSIWSMLSLYSLKI